MNNFIANVVSISNLVPRIFLWRDPGNEVDQYLVYNIETDLKLILPRRVPPARSAHGAAVYNQKLWVFAGYDGSKR